MISETINRYLTSHHVLYRKVRHPLSYTAQNIARFSHIPGRFIAKTVVLDVDGKIIMAVMPATKKLDFKKIATYYHTQHASLVPEKKLKEYFPDCELGAMPPLGNLYNMDVLVSLTLADDDVIYFNGGNHTELIEMSFHDFLDLVHPKIVNFTYGQI